MFSLLSIISGPWTDELKDTVEFFTKFFTEEWPMLLVMYGIVAIFLLIASSFIYFFERKRYRKILYQEFLSGLRIATGQKLTQQIVDRALATQAKIINQRQREVKETYTAIKTASTVGDEYIPPKDIVSLYQEKERYAYRIRAEKKLFKKWYELAIQSSFKVRENNKAYLKTVMKIEAR